ncbi:MAG: ABC transporter permease [Caldilineae bacterium]|nr:MAG: ABC transporter permease [Caldilineae bacterium]
MTIGNYELRLKKRASLAGWEAALMSLLAIVVALALFSVIFIQADVDPLLAYREIFSYSFTSQYGVLLTINRFIFLLLCTAAFIVPFRAGLWNIGMAGQLYVGALSAFGVLYFFGAKGGQMADVSPGLVILLMLVASALGGALVGAIAGFLKGALEVNEIVVTMMLNFIAFWLVAQMIKEGGPFMNPGGRGESFEVPEVVYARLIGGVPFTLFIALGVAVLLYFLFAKTKLGYQIRAYGLSPAAARYAGIDPARMSVLVFAIGGAIAGLAGYHYFAAVPGVYKIARNYGFFGDLAFYGIICGLISLGNPVAAIPVALLFGGLSIGGRFVQGKLHIGFGMDYALLGVLMITLVAFQFFYQYQFSWTKRATVEASDR